MSEPSILLTNDDGIESNGLRALHDVLTDVGDVTVVAPAEDQSAVGRSLSHDVTVRDHELGYSIEGTPADCTVAGLGALAPEADLVVAGCNQGANLGAYTLGRSGTVSAAVEATFFDVPAIAVSMYVPVGDDTAYTDVYVDRETYAEAAEATRFLATRAEEADIFDHPEYLNVNAPVAERGPCDMEVTRPAESYLMTASRDGEDVELHDRIWEQMETGDIPDPEGTDRHAIVAGNVSVSPLTAPHTTRRHESLDELVGEYARSR